MTNIFERATRQKLRFDSSIGLLTAEDIWDLPLTAGFKKPSLDSLARAVHFDLKGLVETSFVDTRPDPRKSELELKLDILKHVIGVKLGDKKRAEESVANEERRKRIIEALDKKQNSALEQMSEEDLKAELSKL